MNNERGNLPELTPEVQELLSIVSISAAESILEHGIDSYIEQLDLSLLSEHGQVLWPRVYAKAVELGLI